MKTTQCPAKPVLLIGNPSGTAFLEIGWAWTVVHDDVRHKITSDMYLATKGFYFRRAVGDGLSLVLESLEDR